MIWGYCHDLPVGAPVDPWSTSAPSAAHPSSLALASGGKIYFQDAAASALAAARRANLPSTIGQPVEGWWAGEVVADQGSSECVGITGLHETTYSVRITIWHQRKPMKAVEAAGPEGRWELSRLLSYLRGRFLALPTLAGALACVCPDGMATLTLDEDTEWNGVPVHQGTLSFDVVERELITMAWS